MPNYYLKAALKFEKIIEEAAVIHDFLVCFDS